MDTLAYCCNHRPYMPIKEEQVDVFGRTPSQDDRIGGACYSRGPESTSWLRGLALGQRNGRFVDGMGSSRLGSAVCIC